MGKELDMQSTRQDILQYLQRHGRATVKELRQLLGLTSTGIRQHLTVLERDGLIRTHEERGKVGRPALVFTLTEKAEALSPKQYDALANLLIEEIIGSCGNQQVQHIIRGVAARMAEPLQERVQGKSLPGRVAEAVAVMREEGINADWEQRGDEFIINEYTCPYAAVARRHRAICALEVDFVRRLTATDTRLSRSLLRGEAACTYRIRPQC